MKNWDSTRKTTKIKISAATFDREKNYPELVVAGFFNLFELLLKFFEENLSRDVWG